ncbi:MAG: SDR family oxidoreductase [Sandaracinaceae bacterium]|nr:SDR family oxidoreductase [Sandaracinaceae bacterium]
MSLYSMIAPKGENGFGYGSTAEDVTEGLDLHGKTILVTGCNSGLGFETVRVLRLRGAHVIGTARTKAKADEAGASQGSLAGGFTGIACELSDPRSVRACVTDLQTRGTSLDALVANAGIMALPKLETAHGYELQFFTNHVGHFLLVTGLLDRLAPKGRVVMLSSEAHRRAPQGGIQFDNLDGSKSYDPWTAYGQSKIANLLFAKTLAKKLAGSGKTANALHPGVIKTNLGRNMGSIAGLALGLASPLVLKSIPEGAATQCFVAVSPKAEGITGKYFSHCQVIAPRREGEDDALADRLWQRTEEIVAALPR